MRYLLDTDTVINAIRAREPARSRVRAISPDDLAISAVTLAELLYDARGSTRPAETEAQVEEFLRGGVTVLPFDADAAEAHADLRRGLRAAPIGERDLMIAATAVSRGLTVVTHNSQHFGRVQALSLEDWSEP